MDDSNRLDQDRAVFKWGGLAGIVGSVAFVACVLVATVFVGADVNEPMGFPSIRIGRTVEDGLYLAVFVLWILQYVALYRALRQERLAPALFGSVLGIAGSIVLAAGTLPHVMTLAVSNIYHSAGATVDQQAMLQLVWQGIYGIIDALLAVGLIISTIGAVCLGAALARSARFGKATGWICVVIGAVGLATSLTLLWDVSTLAIVPLLALVVFHIIAGVKSLQLSKWA